MMPLLCEIHGGRFFIWRGDVRWLGDIKQVWQTEEGSLGRDHSRKGPDALVPRVQENPVDKTVEELLDLDPFVDMEKRFYCTATVQRLDPGQRWWFPSRATCRKSAKHTSYGYKCSDDACSSVEADLTYCVSVFASDDTKDAEYVLFDKVAAGAVGKPLVSMLRQRYPGYATVDEIANVARHDTAIPLVISHLIGQKIEETYKPELPPIVFGAASGSGGASSSSSCLPILGPAMSPVTRTPPALGSNPGQTFRAGHGSPAAQTPASPVAKLSPGTPVTRSKAHMRGARRSLFSTPKKNKDKLHVEITPSADQVIQPFAEPEDDDAAATMVEKDDEIPLPKTKRNTTNAKSGGSAKKPK
ncbi:hypothetical protein ACQ4PT_038686 [Festuca glaucescens]